MTDAIRVIQYGLGPIGAATARLITERGNLELVGAVDIDPAKVGRDAAEVIGLDRVLGLPVRARLAEVGAAADVVVHTTNSYFDLFTDQVLEILAAGFDIVSTSEELCFPWSRNAEAASRVDAAARAAGKTVLGTGVNPGFLMDSLPLFITSIAQRVDHIDVTRVVNASERRGPFQAKIGSGMTVEAFRTKMAEGRMGHVGLSESVAMLFDTLGRKLVRLESSVEPVVAEKAVKTRFFDVPPGRVRGLHQTGHAYSDNGEFVSLTFRAALDEQPDGDTITIRGCPDLTVKLKGTNGDLATVAMAVNAIRRTKAAAPGLVTMRDLPIVTA
jgi:2,4-diaminopentanoate dehydrogenase